MALTKTQSSSIFAMFRNTLRAALWLACAVAVVASAKAQSEQEIVLHRFKPYPRGAYPNSALIRDAAGNLYGTAVNGGTYNAGVVFKLNAAGQQSVFYNFTGGADGGNPYSAMISDDMGNLYGTASSGGAGNEGVIYEIDNTGQFTVLHSFTGGTDGANPQGAIIFDPAGNLYGTAVNGGTGGGVVWELTPAGSETILYSFSGSDGYNPFGALIRDEAGTLYGTTTYGGQTNFSNSGGVLFKLDATGDYTVLFNFDKGGPGGAQLASPTIARDAAGNIYGCTYGAGGDGAGAVWKINSTGFSILASVQGSGNELTSGVILDAEGNLYGTTSVGKSEDGSVFKVTAAGVLSILHNFQGGADGAVPYGDVVLDPEGNLYGTTSAGGSANAGVLYKISPKRGESVIYTFPQGPDGGNPYGGLIVSGQGGLFGTTFDGGAAGQGSVFKIDGASQETVLYTFQGGSDGANPYSGLISDTAGNLYGTTVNGGANGAGTVFKVDATGHETILHSFNATQDNAANPYGGLTMDANGNLYGTTVRGFGVNTGSVFKIDSSGNESILYTFSGGPNGGLPYSGLILDSAGNLYGTTSAGGSNNAGVVYKLSPAGAETVLYSFRGGADGANPRSILTLDSAGNLYGTTVQGGFSGAGVVFKIDPSSNESVLYNFTGGVDGANPYSGLLLDAAGHLYGTTSGGGAVNAGVVFKVSATGSETVLYSFTGGLNGANPYSGLLAAPGGVLYGTTYGGGAGVVYQIKTIPAAP
jgi:uncharacterized repeat protein (TIGR03803 family)